MRTSSTLSSSEEEEKRLVNEYFQNSEPLMTFFPLTLANGAKVRYLYNSCSCTKCRKDLKGESLRGHVAKSYHGAAVTGFGLCEKCNIIIPFFIDYIIKGKTYTIRRREWNGWTAGEILFLPDKN